MEGYPKLFLTSFALSSGTNILKSGVCIKECPVEAGKDFYGADCKSNKKVSCSARKTYHTYDAWDFCLPYDREALTDKEKAGYDYIMQWLTDSTIGIAFDDMYKA